VLSYIHSIGATYEWLIGISATLVQYRVGFMLYPLIVTAAIVAVIMINKGLKKQEEKI